MGKNFPDSQAAGGADAAPAAQPTVIRAEPGQPWPDPPAGGRWSRNPETGDLTLVQQTAPPPEGKRRPDPTKTLKE